MRDLQKFYPLFDFSPQRFFNEIFESEDSAKRPAVNFHEDGEAVMVTVDLPGLKKEDLKLELKERILKIQGERKFKSEKEGEELKRSVKIERSILLPHDLDLQSAKASMEDGVLNIAFHKKSELSPKQIEIA